jgi:hypothetical protein
MPRYSIPLAAGKEVRAPYPGRMVQIVDTGAADTVNLSLEWGNTQTVEELGAMTDSFKAMSEIPFSALILSAAVNTVIDVLISAQNLTIENVRGSSAANPLYVSGLLFADTPAASVVNTPAVAVAAAAVAILAANANRLEARITNIGPDPVAIGAAGITWANRSIVLNAGETWVEVKGAALAWSAICDAAKAASITVNELIA